MYKLNSPEYMYYNIILYRGKHWRDKTLVNLENHWQYCQSYLSQIYGMYNNIHLLLLGHLLPPNT